MKRQITYFFVGLVVWLLLTWSLEPQFVIAGILASLLISVIFHEILPKEHIVFYSPVRIFWVLVYLPVFFYYVLVANLDVVYRALHPAMPIKPGIVKIRTNLKTDSGITALANSITLTPGTLTVDVTDDGFLYVHWIYVKSQDVEEATQKIAQRFEYFLEKIFE